MGRFFSKFGEVMDVTLLLDMSKVLRACAKASSLEGQRELQASQQLTGGRLRCYLHTRVCACICVCVYAQALISLIDSQVQHVFVTLSPS